MYITFPVLGDAGLATINTRIYINKENMIPSCKDCGQTMNELYIVSGCALQTEDKQDIHIHFAHKHYMNNMNYKTHFCMSTTKFYEFPKSH